MRALLLVTSLVTAVLALAGCPPADGCRSSSECGDDESCEDGECIPDDEGEGEGELPPGGEGEGEEGEGEEGEGEEGEGEEGEGEEGEGEEGEGEEGEGEEGEGEGEPFVGDGISDVYASDTDNLAVSISNATVTGLIPALGNDPAGFFIQEGADGPAVFVAVDPDTLPISIAAGDGVFFTATERTLAAGQTRVTELADFDVSDGLPVNLETLRHDISDEDFLLGLDDLESEIIHLEGVIASVGAAGSSGALHTAVQVTTATLPTPSNNVVIRLPDDVAADLSLSVGCEIVLDGHMWRFNARAQPSAWDAADVSIGDCNAATLDSAVALSATQVRLTFSAPLAAGTVTAGAFDVDGTNATAADLVGNVVTITVPALSDGDHTANVDDTVEDANGNAVGPASADFTVGGAGGGAFLSEVDYDNVGNDDFEFVEIANGDSGALDLTGFKVLTINGSNGAIVTTTNLSGTLAGGDRLVVGNVAGADIAFANAANNMQNDNEAVALIDAACNVVSAIAYESAVAISTAAAPPGCPGVVTVSATTTALDSNATQGALCRATAADAFAFCNGITPGTP